VYPLSWSGQLAGQSRLRRRATLGRCERHPRCAAQRSRIWRQAILPPESRISRQASRRRPRPETLSAAPCRGLASLAGLSGGRDQPQLRRLRHGLDVGGRGPPRWPASLAAVSTRQPRSAAFATGSTPAAEDRLFGRDAGRGGRDQPQWPASLAAVSTPAAEDRRGAPPPSPRSRRQRPWTTAVARLPRRGLDASSRDPQRCPAAFATVSAPAAEDSRSAALVALSKEVLKSGTGGVVPLLEVRDCCN
jgi:hypothetical protein